MCSEEFSLLAFPKYLLCSPTTPQPVVFSEPDPKAYLIYTPAGWIKTVLGAERGADETAVWISEEPQRKHVLQAGALAAPLGTQD